MQIDIPGTDNDIDTDDPEDALKNGASAVAGFVTLFGIIGIATYAYSRIKSLAGVDAEAEIPGV